MADKHKLLSQSSIPPEQPSNEGQATVSAGDIGTLTGRQPPEPQQMGSNTEQNWITRYLKPYSWRLTASYIWIKVLAAFLGWYAEFEQVESKVSNSLIHSLSMVGFAPVGTVNLLTILKVGWVLVITGFKAFELTGLLLYTFTFPIWVPLVPFVSFFSSEAKATPVKQERGLIRSQQQRFRSLAVFASLLVAWMLLYGGASTTKQIIPGVVFSGVVLLLLSFRLFLSAKPVEETRLGPFRWLIKFADLSISAQSGRLKKEYKKKGDLTTDLKAVQFNRKFFVRFSRCLRGPKAQERVSVLVLVEYIASLILVAASAVLFWALTIKAMSPTLLSLASCLQVSVSHFLPGVAASSADISIPLWARIGAAATAWILLVLYIGLASSLLPDKQRATINGLSKTYRLYRRVVVLLGKEHKNKTLLQKKLP